MPKQRAPALVAALGLVALLVPAGTAAPERGVFVRGVSLAGVELGMTRQEVLAAWGERHGVCRACPETTWYFNERPFEPEGVGVVFRAGRAAHLFTLWQPRGWETEDGLALGANESELDAGTALVEERECRGYTALLSRGPATTSVLYVHGGELWGFGLIRPKANPCL